MARAWFRLYCEMPMMPKARRLPDRLFRALIQSWALFRATDQITVSDYQLSYGGTYDECQSILVELVAWKWLVPLGDGMYEPKDWEEHQQTSTSRVRQWRQRKAAASERLEATASFVARLKDIVLVDDASAEEIWRKCVEQDEFVDPQSVILWCAERLGQFRARNPVGFLMKCLPVEVEKARRAREATAQAEREAERKRRAMEDEDI